MIKRTIALTMVLSVLIAGCSSRRTLYSSDTLRVEREGRNLTVQAGGDMYELTYKRVRRSETTGLSRTIADTDTVLIVTAPEITTITDKIDGTVVYIRTR